MNRMEHLNQSFSYVRTHLNIPLYKLKSAWRIINKLVLVLLVISITTACYERGEIPSIAVDAPPTPPLPILSIDRAPISFGICSTEDEDAEKCFGDSDKGFRKMPDGSYQIFFDGKCYLLPKGTDPDSVTAVKNAIKDYKEAENAKAWSEVQGGVEGFGAIIGGWSAIAAGCVAATAGTGGIAGPPCVLIVLATIAVTGMALGNFWAAWKAYEVIVKEEEVIKNVISGKAMCS